MKLSLLYFLKVWNVLKAIGTCWHLTGTGYPGCALPSEIAGTWRVLMLHFCFQRYFLLYFFKKFSYKAYLLYSSSQHAPSRIASHNKPIHLLARQKFLKLILIINMINIILYFSCCCKIIENKYHIVRLTVLGWLVPNGGSSQLYFINSHIATMLLSFS